MEVGRPRVLNEIKKREICAILTVGCSRVRAAQYVGCHPDTIRNEARRDDEFAADLEHAESHHEINHLKHINDAAKEGRYWRAAAWVLERRYPDRYGRRKANTITIEQMSQALAQFADVMLEELPEGGARDQMLARVSEWTAQIQAQAAKGGRT